MTTHSAAPGTPQTAIKAHVTGIATTLASLLIGYVAQRLGMGETATTALVNEGVGFVGPLAGSLALGAIAWVAAFFPTNNPLPPKES